MASGFLDEFVRGQYGNGWKIGVFEHVVCGL